MADYWPAANGNWSTLSNWLTATATQAGVLPGLLDNVYADNRTIYIDIDANVASVRTTQRAGGTAGGVFIPNNGISLSAASVIPGTTTCINFLSATPNSCTIVGTISGSTTTAAAYGINNNSTGTVNIIGDLRATTVASNYAVNASTAGTASIFNVRGNLVGGSGNVGNAALRLAGTSSVLSVTGDVIANNSYGLILEGAGTTTTVFGNVYARGFTYQAIYTLNAFNSVTIYGNVSGGSVDNANGMRLGNTTTGNVFIYGSVFGGGGPGSTAGGHGCQFNLIPPSTCIVYGDVYGGYAGASQFGITNVSTMTLIVTGNAIGGIGQNNWGINNASTGRVFVSGSAIGGNGTTAYGVNNASTGLVSVRSAVGNNFGLGSVGLGLAAGLFNSQNGLAYVEQVEFGSRGASPIVGPVYILPSNQNTLTGRLTALGNTVTFYNSLSVNGLLPPVSSVQAGVVYNVGNSVGTMAVPSASAVQFGVPVDNTVGTAALQPQDVWGYARLSATQMDSMGDRLRNAATTQSIGYQIASFNL